MKHMRDAVALQHVGDALGTGHFTIMSEQHSVVSSLCIFF
jgi:hypothetical protein